MSPFMQGISNYTVGDAIKLNKEERRVVMRKRVDWDKVLICGVSLGFMASVIYMLFVIALEISK